jgi:hypothetical protein
LEDSLEPTLDDASLRRYFEHLDAAACAFGHLHFPYRRHLGRMVMADVASAGIPRDGDLRAVYGLFTFTPSGWRIQIRRVRYPIRRTTQSIIARRVPGGSLLVHKLIEARYRHHDVLLDAARRHSGLPRPSLDHRSVAHSRSLAAGGGRSTSAATTDLLNAFVAPAHPPSSDDPHGDEVSEQRKQAASSSEDSD